MDTTNGLDDYKNSPLLGFELRTVHSAAGRYTDYAIPTHIFHGISVLINLYSECLTKEALDGLGDFKVGGTNYSNCEICR